MTTHHQSSCGDGCNSLADALRGTAGVEPNPGLNAVKPLHAVPFITISRQAGAGGRTLGRLLVNRLNARDCTGPAWTLWDEEMVQSVGREEAVAEAFLKTLENSPHGWVHEFLRHVAPGESDRHREELRIYQRVAMTIRELAQVGRVVIVGRGGSFITAGMPGGVQLRLVAPLEFRIRNMARRLKVSERDAAARVQEIDQNRAAFYRRYWPQKSLEPESFTMTLNAAIGSEERMADCILPLVASGRHCGCQKNVGGATAAVVETPTVARSTP